MYSIDYLIERVGRAVYVLATEFEDARTRLDIAHGHLLGLQLSDYPEHLRDLRLRIDHLLTRLPGREGYVIADNLRKMRKSTASEICALIFSLYVALIDHQRSIES